MPEEKKPLKSLYRDNPETPEGKYLVTRRDGTTVEWPSFVLGARDSNGADTFRFYALLTLLPGDIRDRLVDEMKDMLVDYLLDPLGQNKEYVQSALSWAERWDKYRAEHGDGDPLMGRHRKDDPVTIAKMRAGMSA